MYDHEYRREGLRRGIANGLLLVIPFWAGLAWGVWRWMGR